MSTTRITSRRFRVLASALAAVGLLGAGWLAAPADSQQEERSYEPFQSEQLFSFPGDWDAIDPVVVRTNYPAQASWQFVTSDQHLGKEQVLSGASCSTCHGNPVVGQSSVSGWAGPPPVNHRDASTGCVACHGVLEQRIGDLGKRLVDHPRLELNPIEGKRPNVDVTVRAAYDDEFIYMRFEWDSEMPGVRHGLYQWDGERWIRPSTPKPNPDIPSYEDRITLLIDDRGLNAFDGSEVGFSTVGCWQTCHRSMREMTGEASRAEVEAHPYLGEVLGQTDVRKYTLNTRTEFDDRGGWDKTKSEEEIAALLADGDFLDMIMWRASRGGPLGYSDDAYVLDYRHSDPGVGAFKTPGPGELMYDETKTGYRALKVEQLLARPDLYLLHEDDAVTITDDVEFEVGDLIPRRILRQPSGNRADVLMNSRWEDGRWVLEMRRLLNTGHAEDKALEPGRVYNVGIAIFDDHVSNRRHQISEVVTLGIGMPADITAVSLDDQMGGS